MSARAFTFAKRRNGIVTTNTDHIGFYEVILHNTTVFTCYHDGSIVINSGGWRTSTTKTAINRAFDLLDIRAKVWQKNFEWFLTFENTTVEFYDNMVFGGSVNNMLKKLEVI